VTNCG
jgi:hypothetical protein